MSNLLTIDLLSCISLLLLIACVHAWIERADPNKLFIKDCESLQLDIELVRHFDVQIYQRYIIDLVETYKGRIEDEQYELSIGSLWSALFNRANSEGLLIGFEDLSTV